MYDLHHQLRDTDKNMEHDLDDVTKQQVGNAIHLLHFFKLISETQTECLELKIRVLAAFTQSQVTFAQHYYFCQCLCNKSHTRTALLLLSVFV